jgi:hypothetical protein
MTCYPDLSPYTYLPEFDAGSPVNVGWLGPDTAFPAGTVPERLLARLGKLTRLSIVQTRGLYDCDSCPPNQSVYETIEGNLYRPGSAEIRVFSPDGAVYACPDMLYHYVKEHNYLPPDEFPESLAQGPIPPEPGYFQRLDEPGLEYEGKWVREKGSRGSSSSGESLIPVWIMRIGTGSQFRPEPPATDLAPPSFRLKYLRGYFPSGKGGRRPPTGRCGPAGNLLADPSVADGS